MLRTTVNVRLGPNLPYILSTGFKHLGPLLDPSEGVSLDIKILSHLTAKPILGTVIPLDAGDNGRALNLSGRFHIEIARIADQDTIGRFIETLIARSSLVIALYWRRESALCESHAHHALVQAIADGDEQNAEELMQSHLVDLNSALDFRDRPVQAQNLRELLQATDH
jgi:hypothetical protein